MTARHLAEAELRRLAGEIADARRRLGELAREIASLDPGPQGDLARAPLALIAVDLHSYYTALESLLERILVAIEGKAPIGTAAHAEILRLATRPIEAVRPPLLDPTRLDALDELRRFRHFFRHAYALDLSHLKLRRALDPFAALHTGVDADLAGLLEFLHRLLDEIAGASTPGGRPGG